MKKLIILITGLIFALACMANIDALPPTKITILNSEFEVIHAIDQQFDLEKFQNIWNNKSIIIDSLPVLDWDYKFDIQTIEFSTRWLYSSKSGVCTVLSKAEMPVYELKDYELLNEKYNL